LITKIISEGGCILWLRMPLRIRVSINSFNKSHNNMWLMNFKKFISGCEEKLFARWVAKRLAILVLGRAKVSSGLRKGEKYYFF